MIDKRARPLCDRHLYDRTSTFHQLVRKWPKIPKILVVYWLLLTFTSPSIKLVEGEAPSTTGSQASKRIAAATSSMPNTKTKSSKSTAPDLATGRRIAWQENDIRVVFSDVDGTLVHYPSDSSDLPSDVLKLPPSATGMQGVISAPTLQQCQVLRRNHGQRFVLVSGMRTSTLLKRLPFLPRADAYCSEAGGRIFYPIQPTSDYDGPLITPERYPGMDESVSDPFGIVEDMEWRRRMERMDAAGSDGYFGNDIKSTPGPSLVPWKERRGLLWDFCRQLDSRGYVIDTKGYSACFRVNRKQQAQATDGMFNELLAGKIAHPFGIATSTNLGCVDYYPVESGKKNCCLYLAKRFSGVESELVLASHAICLCDDDNDLEMALACQHAYIPSVSSSSMAQTIARHSDHFTVTGDANLHGTTATERALERVQEGLLIELSRKRT